MPTYELKITCESPQDFTRLTKLLASDRSEVTTTADPQVAAVVADLPKAPEESPKKEKASRGNGKAAKPAKAPEPEPDEDEDDTAEKSPAEIRSSLHDRLEKLWDRDDADALAAQAEVQRAIRSFKVKQFDELKDGDLPAVFTKLDPVLARVML